MSDADLEVLFRSWWSASYSAAPPGTHALITHIGWARFLLEQQAAAKRPTVMEIIALSDELEGSGDVDLVRAALARWGRP